MRAACIATWNSIARRAIAPGHPVAAILIGCCLALPAAWAQTPAKAAIPDRISGSIRAGQTEVLHGTVHPLTGVAQDQGPLDDSTVLPGMSLVFRRSAAQEADLKSLIGQQQTLGSPLYHRWLSPQEFAARYGISASDRAKVSAWLAAEGFQVDPAAPGSERITFSGTALQVNAAFRTEMRQYRLQGEPRWANATDVSMPAAIAGMALAVEHLNSFRPRPHVQKLSLHPAQQSAAGSLYTLSGNGSEVNLVAPSDTATIYNVNGLYQSGFTGSGQTVAIAGQTDILQYKSDIANFRTLSGLDASNLPVQILVPGSGAATVSAGDLQEADIDVEWSGAVAKDAAIKYVTVGNDQNYSVFDALQYAIQTDAAPVISISYGNCEQAFAGSGVIQALDQSFEQANAQGQTIVASSGDSGSADCDYNGSGAPQPARQGLAVDYPASSQYVTGVGGSSFSADLGDQSRYWNQNNSSGYGSAVGYIAESAWNDTPDQAGLNNAGGLSAGGGGVSIAISKPSWQSGPGVPQDGMRDVPDVSLASDPGHDGYVLCTEETNSSGTALSGASSCVYPVGSGQAPYFDAGGNGYVYGGTSIAAPQMAALIALWNQKSGNSRGVGNANAIFYLLAQNSPAAFHDITGGSNAVVCQQGSANCSSNGSGYRMTCCSAGTGYDLATGLGSVDGAAMGAVWPGIVASNGNFSLVPAANGISVSPGSSANVVLALTPANGFSGSVALSCSGLPANTSCSFSPGSSVNLTSGTAQNVTLTVSAASVAAMTAPPPLDRRWPMESALAGAFGLCLLGIGRRRRPYPCRWMTVLLLAATLVPLAALTACGGSGSPVIIPGSPGSPSGATTPITITGTSGANTASARVLVTIP